MTPTRRAGAGGATCDPTPVLPYLSWHDEADRRYKRGERQRQCENCGCYYWPRWTEEAARHGIVVHPDTAVPMVVNRGCFRVQFGKRGKP